MDFLLGSRLRLGVPAEYVQPEGGLGALRPQPDALDLLAELLQVLIARLRQHVHL